MVAPTGSHRRRRPAGHSHGPEPHDVDLDVGLVPRTILLATLALVGMLTVIGGVLLWPDGARASDLRGSVGFAAEGVTFPRAQVQDVQPACAEPGDVKPSCGHLTASVSEGQDTGVEVSVTVPPEVSRAGLSRGDTIELLGTPAADGQPTNYSYFGIQRSRPLWTLFALFALVVLGVARLRGFMAMLGLGFAGLVIGFFVLPGLMTGEPAVPVALAGATAIMYVVLYSTHGLSIRTSAALAGTLGGLAVTALVGWWAVDSTHLTGITGEEGGLITTYLGDLDFQHLLIAAVIIAGLGVLNDVTITQASAVWELRGASPGMSRALLFASGMRIGRDHIASTIYTIVFAYVGTALTLLIAVSLFDRSLFGLMGTEEIAGEVVRSLTSSLGLVLAVPITTAIAVWTVPGPRAS